MKIVREHCYSSVYMKPGFCKVKSRSDCNIRTILGDNIFKNPIIPANMPSVVDFNTCRFFASNNMFYIMHRFGLTTQSLVEFISDMNKTYGWSSISIGIKDIDKKLLSDLHDNLNRWYEYPTYITIDVAYAYSNECKTMIEYVKKIFPKSFLIVGNVATLDGVKFLEEAGVNAIKIFVAPGSACSTKIATGFFRASIEFINECFWQTDIAIIADGGISEPGDVAKAIGAGAHMVMAGGIFAGHDESPGDTIIVDGKKKYCYYGNASYMNKHIDKHIEGKNYLIDSKGSLLNTINTYEDGLRSAVSYSGYMSTNDMCGKCEFVEIIK